MKKENWLKILISLLLSASLCFLCVTNSSSVLSAFSYVAFQSAARYFSKPISFYSEKETQKETETTKAESKTQNLTVSSSANQEESSTEGKTKSSKSENGEFFSLPDDIKAMMKMAKEKSKNDKKEGSVSERQYKNEGVTDKEGVIKVKNTNSTQVNIKQLLSQRAKVSVNKDEPAVLIFHTHTTESYQYIDRDFYTSSYTTRNNSTDRNMVRIGEAIKKEIEKEGYKVIHDTTIHDFKYSGAYARSRKTVEAYLEKYPSIQVVYDIHRDGIASGSTKIKPTALIEGKKVAQVMIISGCQEAGNGITGFDSWKDNLVYALLLQKEMEETFPGLTRPIFFCARKYNMDMTKASLLLEVGSDSNTIEEAYYSGLCIGKATAQLLKSYEEK